VKIQARGKTYRIPVARFDNRKDKTTFVRRPRPTGAGRCRRAARRAGGRLQRLIKAEIHR